MKTILLRENQVAEIVKILQQGGTVAFRTETVYGLGADATNDIAVQKIFKAKGRPSSNPLIVHFHNLAHLKSYFPNLSKAEERILKTIKGALTIVLPVPEGSPLAKTVLAGKATSAVRIPSCRFTRKIIKASGVPLAAPSANTSGRPSPTDWNAVADDLDGKIDAIVMGGRTQIGLESTVIKFCQSVSPRIEHNLPKICKNCKILVLRQGGVSLGELKRRTGMMVELALSKEDLEKSPGTRFKHYAPEFPVVVLSNFDEFLGLTYEKDYVVLGHSSQFNYTDQNVLFLGKNAKQVNANLFYLLREAERILKGSNKSKIVKKDGVVPLSSDETYLKSSVKPKSTEKIIIVEALPQTDEYASARERINKATQG